jgi:hypothetical protein
MSHAHHVQQISNRSHGGRSCDRPGRVGWIKVALIAVVACFGSVPAYAQIGASLVTSITSNTSGSSFPFPSATYSNNVLYIAYTSTSCSSCTAGTVTSVSGAGLTFTEIGTAGGLPYGPDYRRIQAWRALATSGAGTGVVTVTLSGNPSPAFGAVMLAFSGMKTSGSNGADAVANYMTNSAGSGTSLTVTMSAFANSNNRPVAFFSHRAQEVTNNEAGYTELWDGQTSAIAMGYEAEWHANVAETTPSASWATSGANGGFALEIARADTSPLLTFNTKYVVTSSTAATNATTTLADDTPASQTFTLAASQTVLAIYNPSNNSGSTEVATGKQIAISVDGTDYANTWNSPYAANGADGATTFWIGTLAAGSHTIKGRFAANTASTVTINERVLLILILDGNASWYIDDATAQTTTSNATLVNDPSATQAFTASGACKALILYNVGNTNGSTEDQNGKYVGINLGGTDYSKVIKSSGNTKSDNEFTLHYAALAAASYTAQGRFASRFGATVTISRRQLGVLLFADSTLADYVTSNTSVNTTSLYPVSDGQALISRTTTDARELLVVATGSSDYLASAVTGLAYGIQTDGTDRTKSRTSPLNLAGSNSSDSSTAWAETTAAAAHTVQGRYGNNAGATAQYVTVRRVAALWLLTAPAAPVATAATSVQSASFSANWNTSTGATGYRLDVATDSGFTSFVSGYNNLDVGNVLTYSVNTNISANTTYYYRVRAYNGSGTSGNSNTISLTTASCGPGIAVDTITSGTGLGATITVSMAGLVYHWLVQASEVTGWGFGYIDWSLQPPDLRMSLSAFRLLLHGVV